MLNKIYPEEEDRLPAWNRSINNWFEDYDEHCKEKNAPKAPVTYGELSSMHLSASMECPSTYKWVGDGKLKG